MISNSSSHVIELRVHARRCPAMCQINVDRVRVVENESVKRMMMFFPYYFIEIDEWRRQYYN